MARAAFSLPLLVLALALGACGTDQIKVPKDAGADRTGAELFSARCSGCHTLKAAGTHGSAARIQTRERNDGPNFNARCESLTRVLYAIRNGGFSGAIMPQNIVVGKDAQEVAHFVFKYSGTSAKNAPQPGGSARTQGRGSTPSKNQPSANGGGSSNTTSCAGQ